MDWEHRYQAGDTPWDKGAPSPPLLEWLKSQGGMSGAVLVPGCGSGHDVRAIVAASPGADVVGLDVSPSAISRAREFSPAGKEIYELADLFDLPVELANCFDSVFEHTCFCAIDPRRRDEYVLGIIRALKPEGSLLAIFYLNPWDPGEAPEGGGPPFAVSRKELDSLFGTNFQLVQEVSPRTAYPGREGREVIRLLKRRPTD